MKTLATLVMFFLAILNSCYAYAQDEVTSADEVAAEIVETTGGGKKNDVADEVNVEPLSSDSQIEKRLGNILQSTGWFDAPTVRVENGVAFLGGTADANKHLDWAEATAIKTTDVVAVVNRMQVAELPLWNFAPAMESFRSLARDTTRLLPLLLVAAFVITLSYFLARILGKLTEYVSKSQVKNQLLNQVAGTIVGVLVFILGTFIALRVSGLTYVAATLLGGTSLVGLALGFAFRDIAENYLSSILLSVNQPFRVGDLIEVAGTQGFVRKLTTRGTVLNTFEGNQVQLPNSIVFKEKITNYTASPLTRCDFKVGIGFDDSISEAQEILIGILREHTAVASEPSAAVIVESLGASTVNLQVYFWIDQTSHSLLKVKSSVIRKAKQVLAEARISMPDEAREIVFPHGVPVVMNDRSQPLLKEHQPDASSNARDEAAVTAGEGDLSTEKAEITKATAGDETLRDEANLIS